MNEFLDEAKASADLFAESVHVFRRRVNFYARTMNMWRSGIYISHGAFSTVVAFTFTFDRHLAFIV